MKSVLRKIKWSLKRIFNPKYLIIFFFQLIRRFFSLIGHKFLKNLYLFYFPLRKGYKVELEKNLNKKEVKKRKRAINSIRVRNITSAFWANTGAIFGIVITYASLLLTIIPGVIFQDNEKGLIQALLTTVSKHLSKNTLKGLQFLKEKGLQLFTSEDSGILYFADCLNPNCIAFITLRNFFEVAIIFILVYLFTMLTAPILIRKIVKNLPPQEYAERSLARLSQSEILTFIAMKMWELCDNFLSYCNSLDDVEKLSLEELTKKEVEIIYNSFYTLSVQLKRFDQQYFKEYQKALELNKLAVSKLDIKEREFSHHILQFSPSILHSRKSAMMLSTDTILFILKGEKKQTEIIQESHESRRSVLIGHIKEVLRINKNIQRKRKKFLAQLIVFSKLHKYIIGMSSITSTSRSLKVFLRGLSYIFEKIKIDPTTKKLISTDEEILKVEKEFDAFIHRSRAHYGMDLLVTVENFYIRKFEHYETKEKCIKDCEQKSVEKCIKEQQRKEWVDPKIKIPKILHNLKYPKSSKRFKDKEPYNDKNKSIAFRQIVFDNIEYLKNLRLDLMADYKKDFNEINRAFLIRLDELIARSNRIGKGKTYLAIFGYSRLIRNILLENATKINNENIRIFIFKEEINRMMDTRILRYELYDGSENKSIKKTFTGTDEMFISLLTQNDRVVFLAGAEAYCNKSKLLFHTNTYQKRIEKVLKELYKKSRDTKDLNGKYIEIASKPDPQVWILANDYKIYDGIPPKEGEPPNGHLFAKEILSDHYDHIDLYNFKFLEKDGKDRVHLVSNI